MSARPMSARPKNRTERIGDRGIGRNRARTGRAGRLAGAGLLAGLLAEAGRLAKATRLALLASLLGGALTAGGAQEPRSDEGVAASDVESPEAILEDRFRREVSELLANPRIQRAFQVLEETDERTIRDQITLTEIPAPPFNEEARAEAFAEMLREAGADSVWIDPEGNVIGLRRGHGGSQGGGDGGGDGGAGRPDQRDDDGGTGDPGQRDEQEVLAFSGHLDTVFPEGTDVTVGQRGDTLFAPGIGDDARGLATLLAVLRALEEAEIETEDDILFVGTVGEEGLGDLRGMKQLFSAEGSGDRNGGAGPRIDAFISVDGTSDSRITNAALGSHRYRVTFRGPGGHSWGAFGLVNPHHALGAAIEDWVDAADAYTRDGPRTSYNVGRIGGGTAVNAIPAESWMEVDMRSVSPERLNGIDSLFHRAIRRAVDEQNELRRRGPELTVEVEMIGDRPSGEIVPSEPLIQRGIAATLALERDPELGRSSTDSNIPISMGIPAMTIGGGGDGGGAHSPDEWFRNEEGVVGLRRALLIVVAQAGLAGPS